MNHNRLPEEDHLPDWARRDNKFTRGDGVEYINYWLIIPQWNMELKSGNKPTINQISSFQ